MTFDEFMLLALQIDDMCIVEEDKDGYLIINTGWRVVGDDTVPLGYNTL
jgi:hypothetical protein